MKLTTQNDSAVLGYHARVEVLECYLSFCDPPWERPRQRADVEPFIQNLLPAAATMNSFSVSVLRLGLIIFFFFMLLPSFFLICYFFFFNHQRKIISNYTADHSLLSGCPVHHRLS